MKRIPSLDGLRGISILMVLFAHLQGTAGTGNRPMPFAWGGLGVTIFFVISGYLITSLLLKERAKTGAISLKEFYFRRTVRIFPAQYVYTGAIVLLAAAGVIHLLPGDGLAAATYTMNFRAVREWWLGHTWSLAVEEQFYLLWPAAVAFLGVTGGLRVALASIVLAPLFRVGVFYLWPSQRPLTDQAFPFVFDSLATGCALAILRPRLWEDARYRRLLESRAFALVPLAVVALYLFTPTVGGRLLFGETLMHFGIALCIDWGMRFPGTWAGRFLNSRPLVWIGVTSYSLYLWQQLFLCRHHVAWFTTFPQNIVLAFLAAAASYYGVEQPLLRAREAWSRSRAAAAAARATPAPE